MNTSSFQLGYQEALNDIARALAQAGEQGVREWLENNRHDNDAEHEHGERRKYRIGSQTIVVDPDNQPHTHGTLQMRIAGQPDKDEEKK